MGSNKPLGQNWVNRAVKINGAVSPAARAIARVVPVTIAGKAAGKTILSTVWKLEAPTPTDAQRTSWGTICNASSVVRTIIGSISIARAKPPAKAEKPPVRKTTAP